MTICSSLNLFPRLAGWKKLVANENLLETLDFLKRLSIRLSRSLVAFLRKSSHCSTASANEHFLCWHLLINSETGLSLSIRLPTEIIKFSTLILFCCEFSTCGKCKTHILCRLHIDLENHVDLTTQIETLKKKTAEKLTQKVNKSDIRNFVVCLDAIEYTGYSWMITINQSLMYGIFSKIWKTSTIHSVTKKLLSFGL